MRFTNFANVSSAEMIGNEQGANSDSAGPTGDQDLCGVGEATRPSTTSGLSRWINYAPQFYHAPHTMMEAPELKISKTLLELVGDDLFKVDPVTSTLGAWDSRSICLRVRLRVGRPIQEGCRGK